MAAPARPPGVLKSRPLTDLRPQLLKIIDEKSWRNEGVSFAEADGLLFLCPVCFDACGGSVGCHSIICWQPHVPQTITPIPGRWAFQGTSLEDLTLVAGSSSIHLTGPGCGAHFYIRNGRIEP